MSKQDNIAAQEHLAQNINAGNVEVAVESFAQDAVDHDPAPGQGPGREGFKAFFTELTTAFPDAHIEPAHLVADDEHVAIAYTLTGTHEGNFSGVAPTGRKIEVRGVQIGRFEGGKIAERWGSSDELGILKQLGVDPTQG
ncbi:MAG: ester cyclase [Actinomycetota bacterium]|nr:ester cyclase [Actinomycetota bacterium]